MKVQNAKAVTFVGAPPGVASGPDGFVDADTGEFVTSASFDSAYVRVLAREFAVTHGWTHVVVCPEVRRVFQHVIEPGVTS